MNFLVLANLFLLLFLGLADNQVIAALFPAVRDTFHVTVSVAGRLVIAYSVAAAIAAFASGALSDHYGRRRFLLGGALLFAVSSWFAWRARTFDALMLARTFTGLAAGAISTCSIAFAGDWFPYAARGKAIGLISSAYFAAPIVGVPLAGLIADRLGWQKIFLSFSLLAIVASGVTLALPEPAVGRDPSKEKIRATFRTFWSFVRRRDLLAALGIAFLVSGGLVGFITYIGQWLNEQFDVSTGSITLVFMVGGLASIGGAPLGGILSDRWGKRAVSIASNFFLALAFALVPVFRWGTGLLVVFGVTGLGAAFRQGPLTALMTELIPSQQRSSFIGLRNISSQLGIAAVVYLGGRLYESRGYAAVATVCAAMTVLVAVLLITSIREPQALGESH